MIFFANRGIDGADCRFLRFASYGFLRGSGENRAGPPDPAAIGVRLANSTIGAGNDLIPRGSNRIWKECWRVVAERKTDETAVGFSVKS